MNDENVKTVYQHLKDVFDNINHWLDFAEAKNAALVALNVAFLAFIYNKNEHDLFISLLVCSSVLCLISFIPNIGLIIYNKLFSNTKADKDLIYYGGISKYGTSQEYLSDFLAQYYDDSFKTQYENKKILQDIASEIYLNSKITSFKYSVFKFAVVIDIIAILGEF